MKSAKHNSQTSSRPTSLHLLKTFFKLFRYATKFDYLLILLGTLSAIAHGLVFPVALHVLASMTDLFVLHEASRIVANSVAHIPVSFISDTITDLGRLEASRFCNLDSGSLCSTGSTCVNASFSSTSANAGASVGASVGTSVAASVVNCSAVFSIDLPYPYLFTVEITITEILQTCLISHARCLDDASLTSEIGVYIYCMLAVAVAATLFGSLQVLFFQTVCERQVQKMKLHYYRALLRQELGWFDQHQAGELCSKFSDDFDKINGGIGSNLSILIQWGATFLASLAVGFLKNWLLTIVLIVAMPLVVVPSSIFNKMGATFTGVEQKHYASAGAVAEEVLSAIRTVVAFGGECKESKRYRGHLEDARKVGRQKGIAGGLSLFAVNMGLFITFALAFWFGGYLVSERGAFAGSVVAVFFACNIGAFYLGQSTVNLGRLMVSTVSAIPIFQTIDRKSAIDPSSDVGEKPEKFNGSIEFKHVTFSYPTRPELKVIQDFSLSICGGQTVAIVGPSGGGKTTLANLIQRFYDVEEGEILVGGRDIRSLNIKWLRSNIGIVDQEPVLFNTTIAENIRFGRLDATKEDIVKAAKMANVHDFISSLPRQYNTNVGEQGAQLSGGQKQRISIARALVRDPQILLLDEATSALDIENEAVVQTALKHAQKGRTTIVIAHRLSMIQNADLVVSMDNGRILWLGKPSDFFAEKGIHIQNEEDHADVIPYTYKKNVTGSLRRQTFSLRRQTGSLRRMQMDMPDKKASDLSTFFRVLRTNQKKWWIDIFGLFGAMALGSTFPMFALYFGEIVDAFVLPAERVLPTIHLWAGLILLLGFIAGIGGFIKTFCFSVSGENLTLKLRDQAFKAMLRQEMGWFDETTNSTGALTNLLSDDARNTQGASASRIGSIAEGAAGLTLALVVGFRYSWLLTVLLMGVVPLFIFSGWVHVWASKGFAGLQSGAFRDAAEIAVESVENIDTVKSFGLQDRFYSDYAKKVKKALRRIVLTAPLYGISQGVLILGYVVTFRFGLYQVTLPEDHLLYTSFADMFRIFVALIIVCINIGMSTSLAPDYAKAKVSARRIFSLLDRKPKPDVYSEDGVKLEDFHGDITLQDVYFKYPARPEVQVLRDFTMSIKSGQTVALVGCSGCGKSTVVALIERFYDPLIGKLSLDGTDLRDLNLSWLRSQIGLVSQEPVLFDASIAENIRYGANFREVSDSEVEEAAKAANIHSFIKSLPKGYDTTVGAKGALLSGGQKQRVAIARALVRNPRILLLDEATSALDSENEAVVQTALDQAQKGRTSIVISHRLSTIHNADYIAVIKGQKIVELGTHDTLTEKQGIYYRLTCFQSLTSLDSKESE